MRTWALTGKVHVLIGERPEAGAGASDRLLVAGVPDFGGTGLSPGLGEAADARAGGRGRRRRETAAHRPGRTPPTSPVRRCPAGAPSWPGARTPPSPVPGSPPPPALSALKSGCGEVRFGWYGRQASVPFEVRLPSTKWIREDQVGCRLSGRPGSDVAPCPTGPGADDATGRPASRPPQQVGRWRRAWPEDGWQPTGGAAAGPLASRFPPYRAAFR
jgi:hypothetical protein